MIVVIVFIGLTVAGYIPNPYESTKINPNTIQKEQSAISQDEGSSPQAPEEVVQKFYNWYLDYKGNPRADKAYLESEYLSKDLKKAFEEAQRYDPALCAQDKPLNFAIDGVTVRGKTAEVIISHTFGLYPIELEIIDGQWLITDIKCSEKN